MIDRLAIWRYDNPLPSASWLIARYSTNWAEVRILANRVRRIQPRNGTSICWSQRWGDTPQYDLPHPLVRVVDSGSNEYCRSHHAFHVIPI